MVKRAEIHLILATEARSYLKSQLAKSKEDIQAVFAGDTIPALGSSIPACTNNITVHYSFNFAQQVRHTCVQQTEVVISIPFRSSTPTTLNSQGPFTFLHQENVVFLASVVRPYPDRQVSLLWGVCVCVHGGGWECVCVCVRAWEGVSVWEGVCVCVRAWEGGRVCVCVCMRGRVCVCARAWEVVCVRAWQVVCVCVHGGLYPFDDIVQVNYLIDEGMNVGEGANCIIFSPPPLPGATIASGRPTLLCTLTTTAGRTRIGKTIIAIVTD